MKRYIFILFFLLLLASTAEAGLLNDFKNFKDFVNNLDTKYGATYDVIDAEWDKTYQFSLYDFPVVDYPIASLNLGYVEANTLAASATFHTSSIPIPGLNWILLKLDPEVGINAGYDFNESSMVVGPVIFGFGFSF